MLDLFVAHPAKIESTSKGCMPKISILFSRALILFALLSLAVISNSQITKDEKGGRTEKGGKVKPPSDPRDVVPAPGIFTPRSGSTVSAAPVFSCSVTLTPVQNVTYEIEVTNTGTGAIRTFSSASVASNTTVQIPIPYTNGLQPGSYTWRARANTATENGTWSVTVGFIANGGIDILGSASVATFTNFKNAGWPTVYQAAWGGRGRWSSAKQNLINANLAGMKVACYCLINFDDSSTIAGAPANQTGSWQVDQALIAIGYDFSIGKNSLPYDLKFIGIDIETFWGTMSQRDRVQRIAEAAQRIRTLGFIPTVYARNQASNQWWVDYTGNSTDFSDLVLWNCLPETTTQILRDNMRTHQGANWVPYGGWSDPGGKQWLLDTTLLSTGIDINTWKVGTWDVTSPSPGSPLLEATAIATKLDNFTTEIEVTLTNVGTADAMAVRLSNATLGASTSNQFLSVQSVARSGGTKSAKFIFTPPGSPRTRHLFKCDIITGYGTFPVEMLVVVP
jgi:hypothetical protein